MSENRLTEEKIREALKDVIDYEIGLDVISLGLIYNIDIDENNNLKILMTLSAPMCPLGPMIVNDVERKLKELGANEVEGELTFDPPWSPEMMDPEIRKAMGI